MKADYGDALVSFIKQLPNRLSLVVRQQPVKALLILCVLVGLYVFLDEPLLVFFLWSVILWISYALDTRVFFAIALLFFLSALGFLLAHQDVIAEQMAIYTYYILVGGVVIELFQHAERIYQKNSLSFSYLASHGGMYLRTGMVIAVLLLNGIGLYFINVRVNIRFAEQQQLLERLGGYKLREEDEEMSRFKTQISAILDVLSRAAYEKMADSQRAEGVVNVASNNDKKELDSIAPADVTIEILNGSVQNGVAAQLQETLLAQGFSVQDIGNASEKIDKTTIFYQPGQKEKARLLQRTIGDPTPDLQERSDVPYDVRIIIGMNWELS